MKRVYFLTCLIFVLLHILFPLAVYSVFGFRYEYYPVGEQYVYFGAGILLLSLAVASFCIFLYSKRKRSITIQDLRNSKYLQGMAVEFLFLLSVIINLFSIVATGSFEAILKGAANSTLTSYLKLFLDLRLLYFCVLIKSYSDKKLAMILTWSGLYFFITMLYHSRSGILWIVLFTLWIISGIKSSSKIKTRIIYFIIALALAAPFLFLVATNARTNTRYSASYIAHKLIARISFDEIAGIELEQNLEGSYKKSLFEEKYSLKNQGEQILNSILPGDIFPSDVQPNQYWRAIFAGWREDLAKEHYMSMTFMLPMYFILKYGFSLGFIYFVLFFFCMYVLISRIKDPVASIFLIGTLTYSVFQYFDWCYHFQDIFYFTLTFFAISTCAFVFRKAGIKRIRLRI